MSANEEYKNRNRGILTERDRRFLLGELDEDLSENAEYQKRYQIRQRIRDSMFDFWIINQHLSAKDAGMIWAETDDWIYQAEQDRLRGDAPPYQKKPFLAKCWRDLLAFFVYSQISTGVSEAEELVEWVIEQGVAKGIRRRFFENLQMYQHIEPELDWGVGDRYRLRDFLEYVEKQMPKSREESETYLLDLFKKGYLQRSHVEYLYQSKFE
ncbi:hypothetical protein [Halobaculum rarum]|uniref:hypothetical protein n=1 Tax=Halobaculum rarum TaxID=3075122 RepID=UPI0032AEC4E8